MAMMRGIGAAVLAAEADPTIRVLLLTGSGDRAFCSGMDLRAFADGATFDDDDPATSAYSRLAHGRVTVPVVGAANGSAIGGGLELLLGSDLIIASASAQFAFPEVRRMPPGAARPTPAAAPPPAARSPTSIRSASRRRSSPAANSPASSRNSATPSPDSRSATG
ncbi:enoyl-CoA hydratase/isomerase family protein [Nocardia gipuzkoensis]